MVSSVSPDYYARGGQTGDFVVEGSGLLSIPSGAIAVYSTNNDAPLEHRYDREPFRVFRIAERTDTHIVFSPEEVLVGLSSNVYLGAIMSYDGETIYWENDTRPLP